MPDVIIKGMEKMPIACCECPCVSGNICAAENKRPTFEEWSKCKPDWCPLRPAPEWIKFTTREPDAEEREMHPGWEYVLSCQLPDDGQRILVLVKYSAHEKVQMDEFCYDADGCYLDSGYDLVSEATHWMPLPEPPKEGTP